MTMWRDLKLVHETCNVGFCKYCAISWSGKATDLQRGDDFGFIGGGKITDQFDSIPLTPFVEEMVEGVSLKNVERKESQAGVHIERARIEKMI